MGTECLYTRNDYDNRVIRLTWNQSTKINVYYCSPFYCMVNSHIFERNGNLSVAKIQRRHLPKTNCVFFPPCIRDYAFCFDKPEHL